MGMKSNFFMSLKFYFHYHVGLIKSITRFKFADNASWEKNKLKD